MYYSKIKPVSIENGGGVRVSLFVSGCNIRCKGCFNQETWDFMNGEYFSKETINEIIDLLNPNYIQGLSILGGEPLDELNQEKVLELILAVRRVYKNSKDIWLYTGYNLEDLANSELANNILVNVDYTVAGPFIEEEKDIRLSYRGSANQRIYKTMIDNRSKIGCCWFDDVTDSFDRKSNI